MKAIKILFGCVTAFWALALVPKLFQTPAGRSDLSFSYHMGTVVGIVFVAAMSIALFRSARAG
jgi:hypothetical protein